MSDTERAAVAKFNLSLDWLHEPGKFFLMCNGIIHNHNYTWVSIFSSMQEVLSPQVTPEHLLKTSARFYPCFEAGIRRTISILLPEPAEKPSVHCILSCVTVELYITITFSAIPEAIIYRGFWSAQVCLWLHFIWKINSEKFVIVFQN